MYAKELQGSRVTSRIAAQAQRIEQDLAAIRQALRRPFDAEVAQAGVTVPQKALMQVVVFNHGISLKELSRQLSLAHSTVSGIVDRLSKRGMLERCTDSEDGRISRVYPTREVTEYMRTQMPALTRGPLQAALKRAKPAERASIEQALKRLRELLSQS